MRWIVGTLLAVLLLGAPAADARPMPVRTQVVVVAPPGRAGAAQRLVERLGGRLRHRLHLVDGFSASLPAGAIARLRASTVVRAVTTDGALEVSGTDPSASTEVVRGAAGLAGMQFDGAGVGVAMVDTGVVGLGGLDRPGTLVRGPDFSAEGVDPELAGLDTFGHGTHVAGLIAGFDPLAGFEGVAPGARIVSVKVAGADGVTTLEQVLRGLDWVRRNRRALDIRVLNLSLGSRDEQDYRRDVLAWAVEKLWRDGIVVVAAAGNDGEDARILDMPAADPYVIAAGASDTQATPDPSDDRVAEFSSRSAFRPSDVVAPGTGIVSLRVPGSTLDEEFPGARVGDGYFRGSGTSQSAAVVSGVVARLLAQRPELSNDQVKALVAAGAVDLPDPVEADGAGRVDASRSAGLDTPSAEAARQQWPAAAPKLHRLFRRRELDTGDGLWSGRRWSGMNWEGRRWSGMKWAGRRWSGVAWTVG
jgi:serine protease AprX